MEEELIIEQIACGPMQNFVYTIGSKKTREVALVDPAWSIEGLLEHVEGHQHARIIASEMRHNRVTVDERRGRMPPRGMRLREAVRVVASPQQLAGRRVGVPFPPRLSARPPRG